MAKYLLLRVDDDSQADDLLRDLNRYPNQPLLTPVQENTVRVELVPGLDAGDERPEGDVFGERWDDLATAVRRSYLRAGELAAEWETSA